ncbi:hypothetical protein UPYG_G00252580 [Umbra pygmaea]|uniref:General transcription factor 3C polypeptide 2 n=1 Tax=Umbra pygmaea TaxID=75934 RepID=A0ABD0W7T9_UMBPY
MATIANKLGKKGSNLEAMAVPQEEATDQSEKPQDESGETGEHGLETPVTSSLPGNRLQRKRVPNPKYQTEPDTTKSNVPNSMEKRRKKLALRKSAISETDHEGPVKKTPTQKTPKKAPAKKSLQKKAVVLPIGGELIKQAPTKKTPVKKSQKPQVNSTSSPAVLDLMETPEETETTPGGRPKRRAAKAALQYLHALTKEVYNEPDALTNDSMSDSIPSPAQPQKQTRGYKRKNTGFDSDNATEDEDFVPENTKEDEESEGEDEYEEELDYSLGLKDTSSKDFKSKHRVPVTNPVRNHGKASNGLPNSIMGPIWSCTKNNKNFRDEHLNQWVLAEWIPSEKDWLCLSNSDSEKYLPKEIVSPSFTLFREGIKEKMPLQSVNRFECLPPHPERWDTLFHTGGPVWAMEWCPTPDGAPANQYAAICCHRDMDQKHRINQLYTEPGLIQLWDLGILQNSSRPPSHPRLAYGIALDNSFVWNLKWCPGGTWELPTTQRKAPLIPRLGLLAASTSQGHISIYSLPHPDTLLARRKHPAADGTNTAMIIYQVQAVITLKRGSFKADHDEKATQVLSMDWLPVKPHNILAAGFYDGTVALWDLPSKSVLQRVRAPDRSFTLYPYHSFIAHDHATRAVSFCHASSNFMVTAGDDRMVKMWDLRKTWDPHQSFKRFLSTETAWPVHWPGIFVSQESTYATLGIHGLSYFDSGYVGLKPLLLVPRKGTMWSLSVSDWLNSALTGDSVGDVILVLLPNLFSNPCYIKRTIERRFPLFTTKMVLKEEVAAKEEQAEEESSITNGSAHVPQTYRETAQKYCLQYHDMDMRTFHNFQNRSPWKHMQATEVKGNIDYDLMPLASVHKVRFNPNLCAQTWVLSGGQAGLVRAHCIRALNSPHINKTVQESEAQFSAMFMQDNADSQADASAVRHTTEML